jgi:hypothetical protein
MRTFTLAVLAGTFAAAALASGFASAETVACEDLQAKLETALKTTTPGAADKAKFDDLKARGDERCKSEDDRRADDFYTQALAMLGQ